MNWSQYNDQRLLGMSHSLYFNTDFVEPEFRSEAWRELAKPLYEVKPGEDEPSGLLEGSVRRRAIGSLFVGITHFNSQLYHRSRATIMRGGLEDYLIQVIVSGTTTADCDGKSLYAGPGDVCIIDLSRPLNLKTNSGSTIMAILPREKVTRAIGPLVLHGIVLKAENPLTRLLMQYITGLSNLTGALSVQEAVYLEDAAISLLLSCIYGQYSSPGFLSNTNVEVSYILRQRVLDFIDENLTLSSLSPGLLLRQFNVSRAHLYRMFMHDGGVAKIIREKRLRAAYLQLIHPANSRVTIAEIAYQFCFSDNSQFLKAFRAYFDATPSDIRREMIGKELAIMKIEDLNCHLSEYLKNQGM